jgi:hypothetical protein
MGMSIDNIEKLRFTLPNENSDDGDFKVELAAWGEDGTTRPCSVRRGLLDLRGRLEAFIEEIDQMLKTSEPERMGGALGIKYVGEVRLDLSPTVAIIIRRHIE